MPIPPISKNLSNYLSNIPSKFGYPFIPRKKISKYLNIQNQILLYHISKKVSKFGQNIFEPKKFFGQSFSSPIPYIRLSGQQHRAIGVIPPPSMYMLMSDRAKIIYLKNMIEQILIIDLVQNHLRSYYIIYSS